MIAKKLYKSYLLAIVAVIVISLSINDAFATTYDITDQSSCLALPSGTPSWNSSVNACTVTNFILQLHTIDTLTVENGTTFVINNADIEGTGTITNKGNVNFLGEIDSGGGIINNGSFMMSGGQIYLESGGDMYNYGNLTISNVGGTAIYLYAAETGAAAIANFGTFTISNTGGTGIYEFAGTASTTTINNYGKIIISNNGGTGIQNITDDYGSSLINHQGGLIIVSNTGNSSTGISNGDSLGDVGATFNYGTISNFGSIININNDLSNSPSFVYWGTTNEIGGNFNNFGTISNIGSLLSNSGTFTNSGTITNTNNHYIGAITNSGTLTNTGNITNPGTFSNSGTITNKCGMITGNPVTGNPVIYDCHSTKTTVSPNPSNVGLLYSIIFSGKVTDTNTTATAPNGTLTWTDGGMGGTFSMGSTTSNKCTLSSISTNASSCKITYKPSSAARIGTIITINSTYSGEPTHKSSSGTSKLTVARATMTAISPINATITHSTNLVFNATVTDTSPGTKTAPTGKISWASSKSSGKFSVTTCTLVPINKSQSQCSVTYTSPSTAGTLTISSLYGGYGTHATSTGTTKLKVT